MVPKSYTYMNTCTAGRLPYYCETVSGQPFVSTGEETEETKSIDL